MAKEKESSQEKKKSNIGLLIVSGFLLIVVAQTAGIRGPLQWLTLGLSIVIFSYAVFIGAKKKG